VDSGLDNDAVAYVGILNDVCVAVFRGTSNVAGWIQDLKSAKLVDMDPALVKCSYNGETCKVGSGFMNNYASVAEYLKGNLTEIGCTKGSDLRITGHSLGAAEAAIAMFDLKDEGYNLIEQYTFGQPRVGNKVFTQAFNAEFGQTTFRVTHGEDPVPHLPFEWMGFAHIATEVYYADDTTNGYKICDGSGSDASCSQEHKGDVPAAIIACSDSSKCEHLNYMTSLKTMLMDGSQCTDNTVVAV